MKSILRLSVILLAAGLMWACSKESSSSDDGEVAGVTVKISPDRTKMLRNPFSGWFLYSGVGDGLSSTFWEDYDSMDSSEGKVNVSDYCTTLLIRFKWSQAEPEEGKYFWLDDASTPEAVRLKYLIDGAKARGLKVAFGFSLDSRDQHFNCTPEYVREKGCQYFTSTTGSTQVWSPYPDDPVFQECYSKFIHAFGAKFDDPDLVQCIEGFGMGKWGEYHNCRYSTGDMTPRQQVFNYVLDLFSDSFKNVPVVANCHRWLGTGTEWDGTKYDAESEGMVQRAVEKGFAIGSAALGMHTYFSTWEKSTLGNFKYKAPITAEGGWVRASHGDSIKGDGYTSWGEVRQGEYDDARTIHANTMDFRYNSNVSVGETWSWFNEAFDLVTSFIREGIYRLYPDRVVLPESAKSGSTVSIKHRWINLGWSYCPTNMPQYQRYKFAFALLDKSETKVEDVFFDPSVLPEEWTSDSPKEYVSKISLTGVPAGEYVWAVAIVNTLKDNTPGIELSVKDKDLTSGGWLRLGNVTIK